MQIVQELVEALCRAGGWNKPEVDTQDVFCFSLTGGLVLHISSPDGHTVIVRGPVAELPATFAEEHHMLRHAAERVCEVCRQRSSTLALQERSLVLYRRLRVDRLSARWPEQGVEEVRAFLYDLGWWREKVQGVQGGHIFSFTMPGLVL